MFSMPSSERENVITVSQEGEVHLVLELHCRVEVHSLDMHLVGEQLLAPGEGNILQPAQPWDTVPQGVEHKGLEEDHRDQAFPEG